MLLLYWSMFLQNFKNFKEVIQVQSLINWKFRLGPGYNLWCIRRCTIYGVLHGSHLYTDLCDVTSCRLQPRVSIAWLSTFHCNLYDCFLTWNIYYTPPQQSCRGVYWFHHVRPSVRAIKKDLRGKYMVCPRHISYFEIMR